MCVRDVSNGSWMWRLVDDDEGTFSISIEKEKKEGGGLAQQLLPVWWAQKCDRGVRPICALERARRTTTRRGAHAKRPCVCVCVCVSKNSSGISL